MDEIPKNEGDLKKALVESFFALPKAEQLQVGMALVRLVPVLTPLLTKEVAAQLLKGWRG